MKESKGAIISFMGIRPSPGDYWTINRHDCLGASQIHIAILPTGGFITECPCCGSNPIVFFECGSFFFHPENNLIF